MRVAVRVREAVSWSLRPSSWWWLSREWSRRRGPSSRPTRSLRRACDPDRCSRRPHRGFPRQREAPQRSPSTAQDPVVATLRPPGQPTNDVTGEFLADQQNPERSAVFQTRAAGPATRGSADPEDSTRATTPAHSSVKARPAWDAGASDKGVWTATSPDESAAMASVRCAETGPAATSSETTAATSTTTRMAASTPHPASHQSHRRGSSRVTRPPSPPGATALVTSAKPVPLDPLPRVRGSGGGFLVFALTL